MPCRFRTCGCLSLAAIAALGLALAGGWFLAGGLPDLPGLGAEPGTAPAAQPPLARELDLAARVTWSQYDFC